MNHPPVTYRAFIRPSPEYPWKLACQATGVPEEEVWEAGRAFFRRLAKHGHFYADQASLVVLAMPHEPYGPRVRRGK